MREHGLTTSGALPATCDPGRPGDLSIVVQGGLGENNLFETANNVRHWRALFPAAQIVLALSGASILALEEEEEGELAEPRLAPPFALDGRMRAAVAAIRRDSDTIVLARPALPLPPIKSDTTVPNNINLQIAAAQAGLARAVGRYVLRTRADLIFLDAGFLDQYARGADRPRGDATLLERRVLISWIYTLNPFTAERLPLHFSDWFHFGLRNDVTRLWDVPDMRLDEALHYLAHPFAPHSNAAERLFNTRLADEQHLIAHALSRDEDGLRLDYHNDPGPARRAMALLADNFVLCDMKAAHCVFPKYQEEFHNHRKESACITPADWAALTAARHVDPRIVLSGKIQRTAYHEFRSGFPRRVPASAFLPGIGRLSRGSVIAHGNGLVASGPRMRLPPGHYVARVDAGPIEGEGVLRITVTIQDKAVTIAEATFGAAAGAVLLRFEIVATGVEDVEIGCWGERLDAVAIHGLTVDREQPDPADFPLPWLIPLAARDGAPEGSRRETAPLAIRPGRYVAAVNLPAPISGETVILSAVRVGARTIASHVVHGTNACELNFDISETGVADLVLRCEGGVPTGDGMEIVIAQRDEQRVGTVPRFYDVLALRSGNGRVVDGAIVADGRDGLLCFGPYADLDAGRYAALIHLGGGRPLSLTVSVTGKAGACELARTRFRRWRLNGPVIIVPFEVEAGGMSGVEVVCHVRRPHGVAVTGLTLERH